MSATAVKRSVAAVAPAASCTAGFCALCGAEVTSVTPVWVAGWSPKVKSVVTTGPDTESGTVTVSPAARVLPSVTVNVLVPPFSATSPAGEADSATVTGTSDSVTAAVVGLAESAPPPTVVPRLESSRLPKANDSVSSALSASVLELVLICRFAVWAPAPWSVSVGAAPARPEAVTPTPAEVSSNMRVPVRAAPVAVVISSGTSTRSPAASGRASLTGRVMRRSAVPVMVPSTKLPVAVPKLTSVASSSAMVTVAAATAPTE